MPAVKTPLLGPFRAPTAPEHTLGPIQKIDAPMKRYGPDDEVDVLIVGVGSAGGVLLQRLARAGFRVVGLEAGPFWDVERDWVSDEAGSHQLYWNELRITGGPDPITLGANNSGRGVGGGSVHWAGFTPRFHPSDFRTHTEDGVGVDWPISYDDIKPYYELLEREIPVSGPAYFPWGHPHGYTYGPHPLGGVGDVLVRGCTKLGIRVVAGGPVAINSGSHADRPHCIYRGFCIQGCKVGAKKVMEVMWAAGAEEVVQEPRYAHLIGGARMGSDPQSSVVDSFGRTHDIANLFCCDGSIMPTQGSANPGLTSQALAARTADYLITEREGVLRRRPAAVTVGAVPIRRDLSPAGTSGRGIPRRV